MEYTKSQLVGQYWENTPLSFHDQAAKLVVWGLHFLALYHFVMVLYENPSGISLEKLVAGSFLCGAGILFSISGLTEIRNHGVLLFSPVIQGLFFLIISWSIFTIVRSITVDFAELRTLFGHPTAAWAWLVPMVMVAGARSSSWKSLNSVFILHSGIGVFLTIVFFVFSPEKGVDFASSRFGMFYGCGFLLLTWFNQTRMGKCVGVLSFFTYFLGSLLSESRTNLTLCVYFLLCFIYIYLKHHQWRMQKILGVSAAAIIAISVGALTWPVISSTPFVGDRLERFRERLYVDTRTTQTVEFLESVKGRDRIIGRGAMGRFWSQYFYRRWLYEEGSDSPERLVFEVGYLQFVLKGGYVMLALFLVMAVPAGFLGFFRSNNGLAKACGLIIIGNLSGMLVSRPPWICPQYVLLWLAIGACLSRDIRMATDSELLGEEVFNG